MNNKSEIPTKRNYIPSSATVTLTATDFNDLIKKVEEAALIKEQLLARYECTLEETFWDKRKHMCVKTNPLPLQDLIGQEIAGRLAQDVDMMAYLIGDESRFLDFTCGSFCSYNAGYDNRYDLMSSPVFARAWEQMSKELADIIQAEAESELAAQVALEEEETETTTSDPIEMREEV
jgi:hypothetical protein